MLEPKVRDHLKDTIQFALKHHCRGQLTWKRNDETSHRVAAEQIIKHIEICGYEITLKPSAPPATGAGQKREP